TCGSVHHYFLTIDDTPLTVTYPLSLHDALPISHCPTPVTARSGLCDSTALTYEAGRSRYLAVSSISCITGPAQKASATVASISRSEEHTSELQSRENLVCRLLLEKK